MLQLEELLDSKRYIKNEMEFMSPRALVEPFLDVLAINGEPITVDYQNEVANVNEDDSKNIAYPRFGVKVDFGPTDGLPGYLSTIGMMVALDIGKPIIKIYTGQDVQTCMNLCIFNASEIFTQDVLADRTALLDKLMVYAQGKEKQAEEYAKMHERLTTTTLTDSGINDRVGELVRQGRTSIGLNHITTGVKYIDDPKSVYYANDGCSMYNFYNAMTAAIGDSKDILGKPNKTLALSKILLN